MISGRLDLAINGFAINRPIFNVTVFDVAVFDRRIRLPV